MSNPVLNLEVASARIDELQRSSARRLLRNRYRNIVRSSQCAK
jgi:hypothetical protein